MKRSPACDALVKKWEGYHRALPSGACEAYPDDAHGWAVGTIGFGTTRYQVVAGRFGRADVREGDTLSRSEAEMELKAELDECEDALSTRLQKPVTQAMFDALISFAYNLGIEGASKQIERINAGKYEECARSFDLYVNANGRPFQGLINRRNDEEALFRSQGLNPTGTPDAPKKPDRILPPSGIGRKYVPAPLPLAFNRTLMRGQQGFDVYLLQCALIGLGLLAMPKENEFLGENFNDVVREAVQAFQLKIMRQDPDGFVGPNTKLALERALERARAPKETPAASSILAVPYYSQRDYGGSQAWSICGCTSVAMVLSYWGKSNSPDHVLQAYGKASCQSPEGCEGVFESCGLLADSTRRGTMADLRSHIAKGRPLVVNGWFTRSGHILVVVGFDGDFVICNDPAGEWEETLGDSYADNPKNGKHVRYSIEAFRAAVGQDGDIWYAVAWKPE